VPDDLRYLSRGVGEAFEEEHLQPDLAAEGSRELGETVGHRLEGDSRMRTVHKLERPLVAGIQRRQHEVRSHQRLPDVGHPQERPVRQYRDRDVGQRLDPPDDFGDGRVQGGLAGAGKSDVVGAHAARQPLADLGHNFGHGHETRAIDGPVGGTAQLAVDAVVGARLERYEVHAE
jgi:hypothetical protein